MLKLQSITFAGCSQGFKIKLKWSVGLIKFKFKTNIYFRPIGEAKILKFINPLCCVLKY